MRTIYILLYIAIPYLHSTAQSGALDLTFNDVGYNVAPFQGSVAYSLAIQPDGKIIAAGVNNGSKTYSDMALCRFNPDGSLDETFGNGGMTSADFGTSWDVAYALAVGSDGRIFLAGSQSGLEFYEFAVLCLDEYGQPCTDFGQAGKVTINFPGGYEEAFALVIQPDGKLVLGGHVDGDDGFYSMGMVRLNTDGSIDTDFGVTGMVITNSGSDSHITSLALQNDGKIVSGGYGNNSAIIARYNSDGTLDNNFGTGGIVVTTAGTASICQRLALMPDGKIIAAGGVNNSNDFDLALFRYLPNGAPDVSFGNNGILIAPAGAAFEEDLATGVVVDPNGIIYCCGYNYDSSVSTTLIVLLAFNFNGQPLSGFGNNGKVTTLIGTFTFSNHMALQPDGKVVVAGEYYPESEDYNDMIVLRYNGGNVKVEDETSRSTSLHLFPNPASQQLFIQPIPGTLSIYDGTGRLALHEQINGVQNFWTIDVAGLSSGLYTLVHHSHEGVSTAQLVIE